MKKLFYLFYLISYLNFINNQLSNNPLKSLICGAGLISTPELILYQNTIEKESNYNSIRIFIDYTNFDATSSSYSNISKSKTLIKEKLSRAVEVIQQLIKIQRFKTNLILTEEIIQKHNLSSYNSNLISGIPYDLIIFPKFQDFDYRIIYDSIKNINFHGFPLVID